MTDQPVHSDNHGNKILAPTIAEIEETRQKLRGLVLNTPVWQWRSDRLEHVLGSRTGVFLKLELLQYGGSFKPRGALAVMLEQTPSNLKKGVTAVSAGNHAIAVAYAAKVLGTSAKVVMMKSANPARVKRCEDFGASVALADDVHKAFEMVEEIQQNEGRIFVHPFEGPWTARGTATLGLEFCRQVNDLDAVIVPIGGGGLCAGVSAAVKQLQPNCRVYGVEPIGADTMYRSFITGKPETLDQVRTIADSLGAPHAAPYSFGLCQQFVDEIVLIDDQAMCDAMALLFADVKIAVEPAGAAATAALLGPLKDRLRDRRVGLIVCGANIDPDSYYGLITRATAI